MSILALAFWLANLACDTVGQLAFKAASLRADDVDGWRHWQKMLGQPFLWLGIAVFVSEALLWVGFLSLVPLSQGVMMGSLNITAVMLGGRLFFGESITAKRALAICLVAAGVGLVGWGGA